MKRFLSKFIPLIPIIGGIYYHKEISSYDTDGLDILMFFYHIGMAGLIVGGILSYFIT